MLGLEIDPNFEANHYMYIYHSYEKDGVVQNRVLRLIVQQDKAEIDRVILDDIVGDTNHNGGRIKIGPDGMLYITAGDNLLFISGVSRKSKKWQLIIGGYFE